MNASGGSSPSNVVAFTYTNSTGTTGTSFMSSPTGAPNTAMYYEVNTMYSLLPMGLTIDNTSGQITGTPTAISNAMVTIDAYTSSTKTSKVGTSNIMFNITSGSSPSSSATSFMYSPSSLTLTQNTAITSPMPSSITPMSATLTNYVVSPMLPAGLTISSAGAIQGTPTGTSSQTSYTVSATNASSQTLTTTIQITVNASGGSSSNTTGDGGTGNSNPPGVAYFNSPYALSNGSTFFESDVPSTSLLTNPTFSTIGLPDWLQINSSTGVITLKDGVSAVPIISSAQNYLTTLSFYVVATGSNGQSASTTVSIEIQYRISNYSQTNFTGRVGERFANVSSPAITPSTETTQGLSYYVRPSLPEWMTIDQNTGAINTNNYIPTAVSATKKYIIKIRGGAPVYSTAIFTYTIEKGTSTISLASNISNTFTYTGLPQAPSFNDNQITKAGSTGGIRYSYSGTGNTVYGPSSSAPTNAGSYQVTATVATDDNWNAATSSPIAFTISKANLTVAAENKTKVYGANNPSLTITITGFVNNENADVITTMPVVSTSVTTTSGVGTYSITASGGLSNNYDFVYTEGAFTVTKANLNVTAENKTKVYGSPIPNLSLTYLGFVNNDLPTSLTSYPIASTVATTTSSVGTYSITAIGGASNNYNFVYNAGILTVTKATLTVTAGNITKVYGAVNPPFSLTPSGFVNGESPAVLLTSPTASTTATTASAVGSYSINVAGGVSNNYNFVYNAGTLIVTKAILNVTPDVKTKVYGSSNPALSLTYSGFVNNETDAVLATKPAAATTVSAISGVGTYSITASGGVSNNYDFIYTEGAFTVTKANLNVTAENKTKVYGSPIPNLSLTYLGFVNNDLPTSLTSYPIASTVATTTSSVGTYSITAIGGASNNYNFVYNAGILTVTKATLTVTAGNITKVYGAVNPPFSLTPSGFVNGESPAVLLTSPTASTTATTASAVGSYSINVAGGVSNNYNFVYNAGTLIVTKAILNVTPDVKTKVYGSSNPALSLTYSGFANGETESILTTQPTASTTATTTSGVGTYSITTTGGVSNNYTFVYNTGILSVTKANLTVIAENKTKVYGTSNPALSLTFSGFVNSETSSVLTTMPTLSTTATTASVVGSYSITATGGSSNNYSLIFNAGTLTVTKANLTIVGALAANKVYDGNNVAQVSSGNLVGLVGSDNVTLSQSGVFAQSTVGNGIPVTSTATISGSAAGNYNLVQPTLVAKNITAKQLLIKNAIANNKEYNGNDIALISGGVLDGVIANDIVTLSHSGNFAQSIVGENIKVTSNASISGTSASNYILVQPNLNVASITKKPLIITATGPNKTFGNALTSEVSSKNFVATGMLNGETVTSVTFTPDANGLSAQTAANSTYQITPSLAIGGGGFLESNYNVTYVPFEGKVAKRDLIITATGPIKIYGTSLKSENNISNISFKGLGSGETITEVLLTPDANSQLETLAVGQKYTITPSAAKGTLGDLATNYNITYEPFTGTVTKKSLTITASGIIKTYGTVLSNSTTTSNFNSTNLVGAEAITEVSLTPDNNASSATTPAGASFTMTPSQAKGTGGFIESNYDITYLPFVGKVSKSNVSLSITGNPTYPYSGSAVGPNTTNLGNTDIVFTYSGIAPTIYASNTAPTQAGNYQVIAKLNATGNVNETISSAFTFKIEKAISTITASGSQTYTYNGKPQGPATSTVVGSAEKVVYTYSGVSPTTYAASTIAPKNAGTYQVIASVAADNNFDAATSSAYTFTISKATLKITADNKAKTLNLPLPKLSKFFTGFAQEDDSTSLTTQPVITTTATATSPLGDYPITVTGGSSSNYNLTYEAGILTIDLKIDPTISLSDVKTAGAQAEVGVNGNVIKSNSVNSFNYVTRNFYTANKKYGDAPFTLSASSNSNGSFTFRSHNTNVLTISGNVVTIVGAGTALIEVIQGAGKASAGSDEFHEGNAAATVVVSKASSSIVITGNASYTYSSNAEGPSTASVKGSNGQVTYNYIGTGTTTYNSSNRPNAIGTYNATATVASNENYNAAVSDPFNFEIAKASSTITVKGLSSFIYNGLAQGTNSAIASGSNGAITYSYKGTGTTTYGPSATQPISAGTYEVTATVAENGNYKSAISDPFSFTIVKEISTIFAIGDKNYTYKGSAQGPNSTSGVTGSTGAITFSYQGTGTTTYGPSAIAPANSGTYQVIATVASDLNYNAASSPAFEFTIIKERVDLRITGNTSYTYIANPQGPNSTNLSGSNTAITFAYNGINGTTYGPSATRPTRVGTYNVVATATEDDNQFGATSDVYEFTIIKAASSIAVVGNAAYVYNESALGPNDKDVIGSTGLVTYSYSGTGNTTYTASATAPTLVGTYQVIATVVSDENYNGAVSSPFSYAITKRNSTVTVIGATSFTYSGTAQGPNANAHTGSTATITYKYAGTGTTVFASSATAPTNTGTYQVVATLPSDDNNNSATSAAFDFAITKAASVISVTGLNAFTYTGKAQGPNTATVTGTVGAITYSYVGVGSTSYTASALRPTNVGSYQVTATAAADDNYNAASSTAFTYNIIKAPLTVTALNASKTVNTANPSEFYLEYTGFVTGESESNLTTKPTASTTATTSSPVGNYPITVGGGVSNNYNFTYRTGTLTIDTRLTPTIALSDLTKTYGDASFAINATSNSQGTFTYRSSNTNVATITGNNITIVGAGTTSIIVNQAADAPNNFLASSKTASLIVAKAPLTVTASNKTKVYGTSNPSATSVYAGFVNGDNESAIITVPTLSHTATIASPVGNYTISASNAAADNYTIAYVSGALSVTKAPLTITATEVSKTYGASLAVINNSDKFTAATAITGESVTSVTLTPDADAAATTTAAGASYQITPSAAAGTGGFVATNYEITYVPYTGVVTKKALTITATGPNKVYGSVITTTTNDTQFTSSGLVTGETITGVTLTPNTAGSAATTAAGVAYTVTPSLPTGANGFIAANYNITYVPFEGSVSKKSLTATADNKSKIYGATNPVFTITYEGFANSENASVLTLAPVASTSATGTSNVGNYDIAISNGTAANYTLTVVKGALTITKATLTVTAENKSRIYGASNPTLTFTYAGFVNDQTASSLSTGPTASTTAKSTSKVGDYDITLSGAADNNYDFVYNKGKLTINKATLTVTAQNNERCFAANDPALSYIVLGFANGEDTTVFSSQIKMKTNTSATTAAGDYKTIAYDASAENYTFEFIDGVFIVRPLPIGTITSSVDYVCDGANLLLTTSGAAKYVWYKDGVAVANATTNSLTITSKGDYKAKLISTYGCEAMATNTLAIKQYYAPVASFDYQYYCVDKPVYTTNKSVFTTSGPVKFVWDNGAGGTSAATNPTFTYNTVGNKSIKLSVVPDFCPALKNEVSKVVPVEAPKPAVRLPLVDAITADATQLQARTNVGITYEWSPMVYWANSYQVANPTVMVTNETLFNIKMTAASSCVTVDTLQVRVFNKRTVYLPNTFTPNGDGVNDIFKINPVGIRELRYFRIVNQWGVRIFETTNLSEGWDGRLNGVREPIASYTWMIEAVDTNGQPVRESGTVTLIR